ncbi:MAG: MFS transporter [Rhodocyclaceae bacterium]|nr:MFS transporter [Rhodocyclaceae bacterium]
MSSQSHLLGTRRFLPLFITQLLGALNDNVLKNAMVVLLTFQATSWTTIKPELLGILAGGIFILPFFLFSATAGQLADKYDKAKLAQIVKLLEMAIVGVAGAGFVTHNIDTLFASVFLLGMHSTLFGPIKYAILPQHLKPEELIGGNGLIEAGTFVAILGGTLLGGLLAGSEGGTAWITGVGFCIAAVGYFAARTIPTAPAPAPDLKVSLNIAKETWNNIQYARADQTVFLSIMGISWFWLFGSIFLGQFPSYTKNILGGSETAVTLLLATFTFGIGVGSLLCEKMSSGRVEIGLVPFGSIGLTLFALDLAFASPSGISHEPMGAIGLLGLASTWRVLFDLAMIGIFGGFFIVPLYALVQQRANPEHGARIIAANNIVNALFMVVGAVAAAGMLSAGLSIPMLFAVVAVCNAVVVIFIYGLIPEFLLRFIIWILIHTVYRLRVVKLDDVPDEGPAVIVCNHVSFVDALVIMAACPRPIRFVMDKDIFRWPILNFAFRSSKAIPIASAKSDPALMELAFAEVAQALDAGDLVGIFPEGKITGDGNINPFRSGITRILERNPVPVVPMALRGLWGSTFSRIEGAAMKHPFRRGFFTRIELISGNVIAASQASPERLHAEVSRLRGDWR